MKKVICILLVLVLSFNISAFAKKKNKTSFVSEDSSSFMTFSMDENEPYSKVGLPNTAAVNDEYVFLLDNITNDQGKNIVTFKLKKVN